MENERRAFVVTVKGFSMFGAVAAETAGKAKYRTFVSCRDAGYENVKYTDISARRDPSLDIWAKWERRPQNCYTFEYLEYALIEAKAKEAAA